MKKLFLIAPLLITLILLWPRSSEDAKVGGAGAPLRPKQKSRDTNTPLQEDVLRQRYALDYSHEVRIGEALIEPTRVRATWTTEPFSDERIGVTLSHIALSGVEDLPSSDEMRAPFELVADEQGRLRQLGFSPETSELTKGLMTALACALWYTPGDGHSWTIEEDDRSGRYTAVYSLLDNKQILRRRAGFVAGRGARGLSPEMAKNLSSKGEVRYTFDEDGLLEIVADETISLHLGEETSRVEVNVLATLRRIESASTPLRHSAELPLEGIRGHERGIEISDEDRDISRLGDATWGDLLLLVESVRTITPGSSEATQWNTSAFMKIRALLRLQPESAKEVAQALLDHATDDPRITPVLAGSLASANTEEATAALVGLASAELHTSAKMTVVASLGSLSSPTEESVAALTASLDEPSLRGVSALALGRSSIAASADLAASVVSELISRYAASSNTQERLIYLKALANTGSPDALPIMIAALEDPNIDIAAAAAYGLRFIPGDAVDSLLASILNGPAAYLIKDGAIRAAGVRSPTLWRARLQELLPQYESIPLLRDALIKVLTQWAENH